MSTIVLESPLDSMTVRVVECTLPHCQCRGLKATLLVGGANQLFSTRQANRTSVLRFVRTHAPHSNSHHKPPDVLCTTTHVHTTDGECSANAHDGYGGTWMRTATQTDDDLIDALNRVPHTRTRLCYDRQCARRV